MIYNNFFCAYFPKEFLILVLHIPSWNKLMEYDILFKGDFIVIWVSDDSTLNHFPEFLVL